MSDINFNKTPTIAVLVLWPFSVEHETFPHSLKDILMFKQERRRLIKPNPTCLQLHQPIHTTGPIRHARFPY